MTTDKRLATAGAYVADVTDSELRVLKRLWGDWVGTPLYAQRIDDDEYPWRLYSPCGLRDPRLRLGYATEAFGFVQGVRAALREVGS
jgi:hypothetical protein